MAKKAKEKRNHKPLGKFEYKGSEYEVFKDTVKINGTKWRKLRKK